MAVALTSLEFTAGEIKVFKGESKYKPLISAFDPNPIPIKYFAFAGFEDHNVHYFYDCPCNETAPATEMSRHELLKTPLSSTIDQRNSE